MSVPEPGIRPDVSVVIPTNRSPEALTPCLRSLAEQSIARHCFEVIVVNDGAFHDLQPLADEYRRAHGLRVCVLEIPASGPGPARNRGVREATGDLLAFTDDDCVPERDWLERLVAASAAEPHALLGGRVYNLLRHRLTSEASQLLVDFLYDYYNRDPHAGRFFTSNNIAARRNAFLAHGGFDASFRMSAGEDRDLCARWREQGGPLVFVPEARVGHGHALTIGQFGRQHFRYGRGAAAYWRARRRAGRGSLSVEPPGFYWQLLCYPARRRPWTKAIPLMILFAVAQAANGLGFLLASRGLTKPRG